MPHYHFHVPNGRDEDGVDLPDIQSALAEALRFLGEMLRDTARRAGTGTEWSVEVTDESGMSLFRLSAALELPVLPKAFKLA